MATFSVKNHLVWTALRQLGTGDAEFTVRDFVRAQGKKGGEVSEWSAHRYFGLLLEGEYLAATSQGENKPIIYRFVRDTGICAPVAHAGGIYDPNLAGPVHYPMQRVWNALRLNPGMAATDISYAAECDRDALSDYLRALRVHGLALLQGSGKNAVWELNTDAPLFFPLVGKRLFDQVESRFLERKEAIAP